MLSSAQYNTSTPLLDYAWPRDQDVAATPWVDIHDNPADYYNTDRYALPVRLQLPDHMSLTDVLTVAQFLAGHSFLFHPKADILGKRQTRKAEEQAQEDNEEEVKPPLVTVDIGGAKPDEEVELPVAPAANIGGSPGVERNEEVEEGTEDSEDASKESPPHRTSSRKKRSAPDDGDDADAPVRKSKRLQKDTPPAGKSARALRAGATTGNKVCLMPLTVIVPPN